MRTGSLKTALTVALTGVALTVLQPLFAAQPNNRKNNNGGNTATSVLYSGQATALKIDGVTSPTPGQIVVCDTGALPATGGHLQVNVSNYTYAGGALRIDHAAAMTSGSGAQTASNSTLSGYRVEFVVEANGHVHRALIEADYIYGEATATVENSGRITLDSKVVIQNLRVNGAVITVTGQPNQRVELPEEVGGYLILNETASVRGDVSGDIAVSPIHFFVCHCIEGHVGLVRAGITANGKPPTSEEDCGKVTGGGWILSSTGAKCTFGMSGGIRRGAPWGHLTYQDHGTGMKVQSTAVTGFRVDPSDPKGRIIDYSVTIDGAPGTARLRVVDNGEPGRNDIFDLSLSSGYRASGDLGGGRSGGGNIQNHKCPPGWQ